MGRLRSNTLASAFAAFSIVAQASSFYEVPFPDSVRNAPTIVRGKVGKSETAWTTLPDGSKHLFTYYDVEVNEGFKGGPKSGSSIRIRELGGSKDGVSLNVSGTASFDRGEDVVVTLGEASANIDSAYPVVGMMMGKYNLEKGADGKEYLRGAGIGSAKLPGLRHENAGDKNTQVSLETLREIIRTQAAEGKSASSPTPKTLETGKSSTSPDLGEKVEIQEENIGTPAPKAGMGRGTIVFVLGAAVGIVWFLISRRKKR